MAKASCASIRHFSGNVPICIIADGDFSVDELVELYDVQVIRPQEMTDPVLRNLCAANNRSKLMAMWEGPFEHFLYLDADAIFWGDVLSLFNPGGMDFIALRPSRWKKHTVETLCNIFLDPEQLKEFDPNFIWNEQPYFCSGAFVAKRGVISPEAWLQVEEWRQKKPTLFSWTKDQGIMNYLILSMAQRGEIKFQELNLQVTTGDQQTGDLEQRFPCHLSGPPAKVERPWVLHFCGKKPLMQIRNSFDKPMSAFRLKHYRNKYGDSTIGRVRAWQDIILEEINIFFKRLVVKLKRITST
ncbi:hypothetical protein NT6N_26830 [Oceaniferula spumae]|uniref:Glycosyl transferase n=1 Tax=Oceaniferula spumae TaxID=2979115 RepID=A0AAT9FNT9_9BACT